MNSIQQSNGYLALFAEHDRLEALHWNAHLGLLGLQRVPVDLPGLVLALDAHCKHPHVHLIDLLLVLRILDVGRELPAANQGPGSLELRPAWTPSVDPKASSNN